MAELGKSVIRPDPSLVRLSAVDVTVLRLCPGDVVVAQLDESWDMSFVEVGGKTHAELAVDALREAFKQAGHENVGVLVTHGGRIELSIVRPEEV